MYQPAPNSALVATRKAGSVRVRPEEHDAAEEELDEDVDEPACDVQRQPLAGAVAVGVHGGEHVRARDTQRARRDEEGVECPRARREPRGVPLRIERAPEDRAEARPVQHALDDRPPDVARASEPRGDGAHQRHCEQAHDDRLPILRRRVEDVGLLLMEEGLGVLHGRKTKAGGRIL